MTLGIKPRLASRVDLKLDCLGGSTWDLGFGLVWI